MQWGVSVGWMGERIRNGGVDRLVESFAWSVKDRSDGDGIWKLGMATMPLFTV